MDNNKKFWDKVATLYTPLQEKSNRKIYDKIIERCDKYINKETSVLELASGTGQFTFSLCNKAKSYVATDFSSNMIEEIKKRSETILSEEERKSVTFSVEDATNLPYEDKSFDCVLIANALHIMPDPRRALREIRRVLKDDGVLIAPTFVYEGKINKLRMFMLERAGFKTYNKWSKAELGLFLKANNFTIEEIDLIEGKPLPECFVVAK